MSDAAPAPPDAGTAAAADELAGRSQGELRSAKHEAAPAAAPMSAGALLRDAREQAGLHIRALAASLKVPVGKLEALEADRLDLLPDAVFARALASSVCRTLKLDPGPVLRRLPDQAAARLQLDAKVRQPSFNTPHMGWRVPLLSRLPRPAVIAVATLLLAAVAVLFVPSLDFSAPTRGAELRGEATLAPPSRTAAAAPVATSASVVAAIALPAAAPASEVPTATPSAEPAALNAVAGAAPERAAQTSLVVFKARGSSWIEVTDASGAAQLRKTLVSGETVETSGTPPLSVIVGRADSTEVLVRGTSFDLAPVSKDNVARFQIK